MKKNNINWILSDVDGTLLYYNMETKEQIIDQKVIEEIKKFVDDGKEFTLASGRNHFDLLGILDKLEIRTKVKYLIACNGSIIYDVINKKILYQKLLSSKNVEQIFQVKKNLQEKNKKCVLSFYLLDGTIHIFANDDSGEKLKQMFMGFESNFYKHTYKVNQSLPEKFQVVKAIFHFLKVSDNIEKLQNEFESKISSTEIYFINDFVLEVNPKGSSKGNAAKFIENYDQDLWLKNAMAIGDGGNDIEMFIVANQSITLSKARDSVKIKATKIIDLPVSLFAAEAIKNLNRNNFC